MLQMTNGLRQLGVEFIPSYANFVSIHIDGESINALKVYKYLLRQG